MGTRNLTMVISHGQTKVAQYGPWDGYPTGQGAEVLHFLTTADLETFEKALDKCRFTTKEDKVAMEKYLALLGSRGGFINDTQSEKFDKKYPYLNRDIAAKILEMILNSKDKDILLQDQSNFAEDSLFCEWAYIIDLDNKVLEVYKGFNKSPLEKRDRFYSLSEGRSNTEYYPIKLAKSYSFSELPTVSQMEDDCKDEDEDENDD